MKDKLTKNRLRGFDYLVRRLGIFGAGLMTTFLAIMIPINTRLANNNSKLNEEIGQLREEYEVALKEAEVKPINPRIKIRIK